MKLIKKVITSWRHFGTLSMLSKAWEKFVIDRYRFRSNLSRQVPKFEKRRSIPRGICESNNVFRDKTLRICYLIHFFYPDKKGGTEQFVLNLAKEQVRLGNHVCIVTLGKREVKLYSQQIQGIVYDRYIYEGINVTQLRYRRAPRGLYYDAIDENEPNMAAFAIHLLEKERFDIVHAAYAQPFATFLNVCHEMGIPYIVTATDFNIMCHYATLVAKDGSFCTQSQHGEKCQRSCRTYGVIDAKKRYINASKLLKNACYVTAPSEFVAQVIAKEFGKQDVWVIPHGLSTNFKNNSQHSNTKHFVYVGTLSDLKGVHLLVTAFTQVIDETLTLDIYGDGVSSYVERLKTLAQKDPRITIHRGVSTSEVVCIYQSCDCVVVPSMWFETYNFVLREALMCGCLVIASNIGAMPEAIIEGRNGFLFTVGDVNSLRQSLALAVGFQWSKYQQVSFTHTQEEGQQYNTMYHSVMTGGTVNAINKCASSGL